MNTEVKLASILDFSSRSAPGITAEIGSWAFSVENGVGHRKETVLSS